MKQFMFFCYMSSLFFTTSGCLAVVAVDTYYRDRAQQEEVIKVQRDMIECVRQSSEAGLGSDKPCPFTDPMSVFKWDFGFLHASKEYFAQKMLQEYNFDPGQKKFVEDCLQKKGYFKPKEPAKWLGFGGL